MKITQKDANTLMRWDLNGFIESSFYELNPTAEYFRNWHIEVIAAALEKVRRGEITRLIINVPPRSLKSHCASIALPAWLLGHNPTASIICASYSQDLADKFARDCRTLMLSEHYQRLFSTRLSTQRTAVQEFTTTKNGFRLATSVGGTLTGRGAEFIIIDDPLKPEEAVSDTQRQSVNDWYDHTLYSRLNNKKTSRIIIIMQRLHEDDLVGHVKEHEPWTVLSFPAIAEGDEVHEITNLRGKKVKFERAAGEALHPEWESLEVLGNIRKTQGEYNWAGQYQQAPAPLGGGLVKLEWFKRYAPAELPEKFEMIFQSWDTANKPGELNDYSVCTTWGLHKQRVYLLDVFRARLDYPALKRAVADHFHRFKPRNILIEDKASGTQLIQELQHERVHVATCYKPEMDKVMRMHSASSVIENGAVFIPESADWLDAYLHELTVFPRGKYDDQVDSTSQALDWFKQTYTGPSMAVFYYMRDKYEEVTGKSADEAVADLIE